MGSRNDELLAYVLLLYFCLCAQLQQAKLMGIFEKELLINVLLLTYDVLYFCLCAQLQQAKLMGIRNEEVRRSIEDLLALVAHYPRENKGVSTYLLNTPMKTCSADLLALVAHYPRKKKKGGDTGGA